MVVFLIYTIVNRSIKSCMCLEDFQDSVKSLFSPIREGQFSKVSVQDVELV